MPPRIPRGEDRLAPAVRPALRDRALRSQSPVWPHSQPCASTWVGTVPEDRQVVKCVTASGQRRLNLLSTICCGYPYAKRVTKSRNSRTGGRRRHGLGGMQPACRTPFVGG